MANLFEVQVRTTGDDESKFSVIVEATTMDQAVDQAVAAIKAKTNEEAAAKKASAISKSLVIIKSGMKPQFMGE